MSSRNRSRFRFRFCFRFRFRFRFRFSSSTFLPDTDKNKENSMTKVNTSPAVTTPFKGSEPEPATPSDVQKQEALAQTPENPQGLQTTKDGMTKGADPAKGGPHRSRGVGGCSSEPPDTNCMGKHHDLNT